MLPCLPAATPPLVVDVLYILRPLDTYLPMDSAHEVATFVSVPRPACSRFGSARGPRQGRIHAGISLVLFQSHSRLHAQRSWTIFPLKLISLKTPFSGFLYSVWVGHSWFLRRNAHSRFRSSYRGDMRG